MNLFTTMLAVALVGALLGCTTIARSRADLRTASGKRVTVEGIAKLTPMGGPTVVFNDTFVLTDMPSDYARYISHRVRVSGDLAWIPDPLMNLPSGEQPVVPILNNAEYELLGDEE